MPTALFLGSKCLENNWLKKIHAVKLIICLERSGLAPFSLISQTESPLQFDFCLLFCSFCFALLNSDKLICVRHK